MNSTGRGKDSRTLYKARLESVAASKEVRDKFSSFFTGGKDARPAHFSQVSIRNCVTPGTLARVAVLQLLAKRYKESNAGSRTQVIAYDSRPTLKITPPSGASDTRTMTFTYIEAIQKLPTSFTQAEIDGLIKRISPRLHGNLRSLLIVVDDDMLQKKKLPARKRSAPQTPSTASGSESSEFRTPDSGQAGPGSRKRIAPGSSSGSGSRRSKK